MFVSSTFIHSVQANLSIFLWRFGCYFFLPSMTIIILHLEGCSLPLEKHRKWMKKNSKCSETIYITLINAFEMFYSNFGRQFAKPIHYASKYDLENQEKIIRLNGVFAFFIYFRLRLYGCINRQANYAKSFDSSFVGYFYEFWYEMLLPLKPTTLFE